MVTFRRSCTSLALLVHAVTAFAQAGSFPTREAAIAAAFPNKKASEWVSTEADFNGDGIKDLAVILTLDLEDKPIETRLVVLAGGRGGKYSHLSISAKYCDAQKFFNLEAKGTSLFVSEVHKADGDGLVSNTLQFRFNPMLADFELTGRENIYESFRDKEYGRTSVNYPAGMTTVYERKHGRIMVKERSRFAPPLLARLNAFDCDNYFDRKPY